jgi:hypothetical protein
MMRRSSENIATSFGLKHGKSTAVIKLTSLQLLSVKWLFPGLFMAMVASNQPWMLGSLKIGQYISLVNYLAVAVIVFTTFRRKLWPMFILMCIVLAGALSFVFSDMGIAFDIFLNIYFCAAGAVIITRYPNLIYKQVMIICLLNMMFMIVQVVGIGSWPQFLATHGVGIYEPTSTLFVQLENLKYDIRQARPAGLTYSNIIVSLIVLFGLALHLSRSRGKFAWGTLILCTMVVLSMAKIVFLGLILIALSLVIVGNHYQRLGSLRAIALTIFLLVLYAVLFPGLFTININMEVIAASIFYRLNNIIEAFPQGGLLRTTFEQYLQGTPRYETGAVLSGYYYLSSIFPYIVASLPLLMFFFLLGYFKQRIKFPHLLGTTMSSLIVVAIYPAAISFWSAQIYWFVVGFALLPLFILLQPRYFKGSLEARFESVHQ